MKLHLIDGTYELFRTYFGAPPRRGPDGMQLGAVYGIIAGTFSLIDQLGITHLAIAFDTVIRSFRNDLYAGYKTEAGVPGDLLAQFALAEEAVDAMGITVWGMHEYEADDAMATATRRYSGSFDQIVMATPDKDMMQCIVGDEVIAYDRRKQAFIDEKAVIEKFGVPPESIPDYLGLVGDSADGLPGLPGWGAKSSSLVLAEYGHIEQIPLEAALWKPAVRGADRLVQSLRDGMPAALFYRYLATLRRDVPLSESVDDLEWGGVRTGAFTELCQRLGFGGLVERAPKWAD